MHPKIKAKRSDILRKPEIDKLFEDATSVFNSSRLQCVIALAWIFGKRINEILRIKREDIWSDENFLYVRFHVSKKKTRKEEAVPKPYLKRIRLEHPYVHYITDHIARYEKGYIFPSYGSQGYITRQRVTQQLKGIAPQTWWHLFRESLATYMAENGATEEELMHWFDWDRPMTAHKYVKRGTKLTEKWSKRKF